MMCFVSSNCPITAGDSLSSVMRHLLISMQIQTSKLRSITTSLSLSLAHPLPPQCCKLVEASWTGSEEAPRSSLPDPSLLAQQQPEAAVPVLLRLPQPAAVHRGHAAAQPGGGLVHGGQGLRTVSQLQLHLRHGTTQRRAGTEEFRVNWSTKASYLLSFYCCQ